MMNKDIIIEYVNNPYRDLEEVVTKITDYYTDEKGLNLDDNIISYYLDVLNNNVVVELDILVEEKTRKIQNISPVNASIITFEKGEHDVVYLNPGEKILATTHTFGGGCAWGYRAKKGNQYGIVTAAH